jgi:hypothetical protein
MSTATTSFLSLSHPFNSRDAVACLQSRGMRLLACLLGVLLITAIYTAWVSPGEAYAALLYAGQSGAGTSCTDANPCSLATGISQAGPGDTVYLKAGVYGGGTIRFSGTSGNPVTLTVDPAATGEWPAKINGASVGGAWGVIDGIEFDGRGGPAITVWGSHFIFKNNYIHAFSSPPAFTTETAKADCLKILAGGSIETRVEDIQVIGNRIEFCGEDAIDVTGARDLVYRGNVFSSARVMQVKGGTENILIENNTFSNNLWGIKGAWMSCLEYCGSRELPTLSVSERFVAKKVTIRNNVFYNFGGAFALGIKGWRDVVIDHNTFYGTQGWFMDIDQAGLQFFDDLARDFCKANPGECSSCSQGQTNCWRIGFKPKNIHFSNNIVSGPDKNMIIIQDAALPLENFDYSNNLFYNDGNAMKFQQKGTIYQFDNFPLLMNHNNIAQDPLFVDPAAANFCLQSNSPALGASESGGYIGATSDKCETVVSAPQPPNNLRTENN